MTSFVRRIVSGQKARFKDPVLDLDLDLVYVTDNIVIMGYPAQGLASLYRNKRADVRRFLDHRHEDLYRVYNFCPRTENEYDSEYFYDRVSRYPFPDHHVPPLSMIPLFVADMTEWIESDPDAVAVIHCKAGKGRSGTMTCCYLISLPYLPAPPQNLRNYSEMKRPPSPSPPSRQLAWSASASPSEEKARDDAARRASALAFIEQTEAGSRLRNERERGPDPNKKQKHSETPFIQPRRSSLSHEVVADAASREVQELTDKLRAVFDLHTRQRMKPASPPKKAGRTRSKSNLPSSHNSTANLFALGTCPAGRSCDALHMLSASTSGLTNANASAMTLGSPFSTMPRKSVSLGLADEEREVEPREEQQMGISIPSQRRWVGYWARMLAGRDPRQALAQPYSTGPRRQIRITRISIDRMSEGKGNTGGAAAAGDGMRVELGRYDDALVERLENWERGARRRAKAFGPHDPSLLAGDLDAEEQEQKEYLKQLRRSMQRLRCWNGETFSRDKEKLIGSWGVNVKAEADRARNFDWQDERGQLRYATLHAESERPVLVDEFGSERADWGSSLFGPRGAGAASAAATRCCWRYRLVPRETVEGKGRNNSTASSDSGYNTCTGTSEVRRPSESSSSSNESGAGARAGAGAGAGSEGTYLHPGTGTQRPRFASLLSRRPSLNLLRRPSLATLSPRGAGVGGVGSEGSGEGGLLDADREVCVRVSMGSSVLGWVWLVPAFEDPLSGMARVGSRTVVRFERSEIDGRKTGCGLRSVEVEWEWVVPGWHESDESDEDDDD